MEWMVQGNVNYLDDAKLLTFDDCGYPRAFKFGLVLCALELRNHSHIHCIVLHLCDARQSAYYWCGVHGALHIYTPSFVISQLFPNFFKQAIALFNMIRSISLDLYLRKQTNTYSRTPLNVIPAWIVQILEVHPFTYFIFGSQVIICRILADPCYAQANCCLSRRRRSY